MNSPTLKDRIEGVLIAVRYFVVGLVRIVPSVFKSMDPEKVQRRREAALAAAAKVYSTPLREIEQEAGADEYAYSHIHSGYSASTRYFRPLSRSSEERRYREADQKLGERLQRAGLLTKDLDEESGANSA